MLLNIASFPSLALLHLQLMPSRLLDRGPLDPPKSLQSCVLPSLPTILVFMRGLVAVRPKPPRDKPERSKAGLGGNGRARFLEAL